MNFKVGDRICCKETLYFKGDLTYTNGVYFTKGEYYLIADHNNIVCDLGFNCFISDVGIIKHFYTLEELRRKKLESLKAICD